ncbi:MAG: hypothetical protein JSU86_03690 [Phycisphaerales bacterium]|nr:MAG: hypothetical protein JSU86_03690 [Phycisphaerales bacterium]
MPHERWSSAKVILGVIGVVAVATFSAVHYVEVVPTERARQQAEDGAKKAETLAKQAEARAVAGETRANQAEVQLARARARAELAEGKAEDTHKKWQECLAGHAVGLPRGEDTPAGPEQVQVDDSDASPGGALAANAQLPEYQETITRLHEQLRDADEKGQELQMLLDECWGRCKLVTPKAFSLDKGSRQTTRYRGVEYGFTFVDWVDRDSTDVMILVNTPDKDSVSVRAREGRQTQFRWGNRRFVLARIIHQWSGGGL